MKQQPRRGLFSRLAHQSQQSNLNWNSNRDSSRQNRLSFASLSKNKNKDMYGSPVLQHKANLMGSPMVGSNWGLNSNYKSENAANLRTGNENKKCTKGNIYTDYNCYNGASPNKHNTTNEHRLFANLVHNQAKMKSRPGQKQNCHSFVNVFQTNQQLQYYPKNAAAPNPTTTKRMLRPESKQKIQKMFQQNPSLIKSRSNRQTSACNIKPQNITSNTPYSILSTEVSFRSQQRQPEPSPKYLKQSKQSKVTHLNPYSYSNLNSHHIIKNSTGGQQNNQAKNLRNGHATKNFNTFSASQYYNSWKQIPTGQVTSPKAQVTRHKYQQNNEQLNSVNNSVSNDNVNTSKASVKFDMSPSL